MRFTPGGPPPLRDRGHPWGLPGLSGDKRKRTARESARVRSSLQIAETTVRAGGSWTLEGPRDPGTDPYPSFWATPEWSGFGDRVPDMVLHQLDLCSLGAEYLGQRSLAGGGQSCILSLPD